MFIHYSLLNHYYLYTHILTYQYKVDYIGRYLLQYVERKTKDKAQKTSYQLYEQKERELKFEDDRRSIEKNKLLEEQAAIDAKLPTFIESLISCNPDVIVSKQDAMDKSCVFLQEYLGLPAVYMAGMYT